MATSRQELLRAHEAMDARILNTGLDRETLGILVSLLEQGVSPEGLAEVIKELRKEAAQSPPTVTPAQVPAPKLAQAQPKN